MGIVDVIKNLDVRFSNNTKPPDYRFCGLQTIWCFNSIFPKKMRRNPTTQ